MAFQVWLLGVVGSLGIIGLREGARGAFARFVLLESELPETQAPKPPNPKP